MAKRPFEIAVSVKLNVDLKTDDEQMADLFLWGSTPATFNLLRRKYLNKDYETEAELKARQALIRLLRSSEPLCRTLRTRLADLFDPESTAERELVFKHRRGRGRPALSAADSQVAHWVDRQMKQHFDGRKMIPGVGKDAAVSAAEERFGLSRGEVYNKLKRAGEKARLKRSRSKSA
jgi:hypothetical protein